MAAGQHIDYEALAQEAMRGVVRAVLIKVASTGLLGDHHFYIAFNTQGSGVTISKRLKEKYPEEMTIVMQHRFWDLEVAEDQFEVKLTFDGIPERLVVPFRCVKVFYDPSVPYGLQFEESELMSQSGRRLSRARDGEILDDASPTPAPNPATARVEKRAPRATPRKARASDKQSVTEIASAPKVGGKTEPTKPVAVAAPESAANSETATEMPKTVDDSKVVDFSKFRNKKS